jgi:hypothetical protein
MDVETLDKALDSLPADDRQLFGRLYIPAVYESQMRLPDGMKDWVKNQFGSLEAVTGQKVVRLTNKITGEETIFNPLRMKRPHDAKKRVLQPGQPGQGRGQL